ncbi:STAS domain-containing protein [Fictibacillus sp. 5RED26]|uniref:STAS domain-containing protein n=1 Tax=Fictibacillus sp. 5RED26 TaxID=2745876 RepID=UPI0018CD75ED|nr:STAS domain-containing protein [Fictibacillus sp. 5RED26]MBH0158621.1 STAS domain-containing protein [Fictibacillus sp. 5RED26]
MLNSSNSFTKIGQALIMQAETISHRVLEERSSRYPTVFHQPYDKQKSYSYIVSFIKLLGESLSMEDEKAELVLMEWAKKTALFAVEYGQSLDIAMQPLPFIRRAMLDLISKDVNSEELSINALLAVIKKMDINIDLATHTFNETYVKNYNEINQQQKKRITDLSVPVVPLFHNLGVLPLIGEIDDDRADILREITLKKCIKEKLSFLIIDISGVTSLTPEVLRHLFMLIDSLRLLGVKTILTGVRPDIALTALSFESEMSGIQTMASLKQALEILGYGRTLKI